MLLSKSEEIVEEQKGNPDFITELVDEAEFLNYIDYINEIFLVFLF